MNLETTIGNGGRKRPKAFNFQAPPESLTQLVENGILICNIANNHSLDYGADGLMATEEILRRNGIDIIGDDVNNSKQLTLSNGKRIGLCSFYGNENGLAALKQREIEKKIEEYKKEVDVIIVSLHWGEEYVAFPSPNQQMIAHALIDAGADVIVGHHPHVMQGHETYKKGEIFYSLGNFNFFVDHPYAKKIIETTKAYCVGLNVTETGQIKYDIIPININKNWQPEIIKDNKEVSRFNNYVDSISKPLKRGVGNFFYITEASPHYFNNHFPSWVKRIKTYGYSHLKEMVIWLINPSIYKYYAGMVLSLFHKRIRY